MPGTAYELQQGDIDLGTHQEDPIKFEGSLRVRNSAAAEALALAVSDPTSAP